MRVVWVNGTFGVGKTTTAAYLLELINGWRYFDPESVGYLLRGVMSDVPVANFQDFSAWRRLVPLVLAEISREADQNIVAVQTVLNRDYWDEIHSGLTKLGMEVLHVVLDCDSAVLKARINSDHHDVNAREWRLQHVDVYHRARPWLKERADAIVDTSLLSAGEVASQLAMMSYFTTER